MNISVSTPAFLNLSAVLRSVQGAVGGWRARGLLDQALMFLLYRRLAQVFQRIERLAARFEAGRLWVRRPGARGLRSVRDGDDADRTSVARVWPGRFGWLIRAVGYQAAGYGLQLRAVLETPEMVALLEASPQAGRLLRPVCRMLAIETSVLRLRPVRPADKPISPEPCGAKRVRAKRAPVDWGRIPLPRGVLSAARRQGFGKPK